jgi:hypothetical protein
MAYTTGGSSLLNDVMPQIKQYRATTGRDMSPQIIQGLLQAKIKQDADDQARARANDLQQQQIEANTAYQQGNLEIAQKQQKSAQMQGLLTAPATALGTLDASKKLYSGLKSTGADAYNYLSGNVAPQVGEQATGIQAIQAGEQAVAPAATSFEAAPAVSEAGGWYSAAGQPIAAPTGSASLGATGPGIVEGSTTATELAGITGAGAGETAGAAAGIAGAAETGGAAVGATEAATAAELAAYDSALAAGAAEGVGSTAGATATTGLLSGVGTAAAGAYVGGMLGHALGGKISDILGTHEKTTRDVAGVAGAALAGAAIGSVIPVIGTVAGALIGGAVGLISNASVICSELLRQGHITERDRKWAVLFKDKYISSEMFQAYLIWAAPYVEIMQRGGTGNDMLHARMMAFVSYMINKAKGLEVTDYEAEVYNEIWAECLEIASVNSERKAA